MALKTEIVIVKYNVPDYEARTIEAVARHTPGRYTLTAYQNEKGVGLAKCWNRLIACSDADYICLLNSDTVPAKNWLDLLLETFDLLPNVGCVFPSSNNCAVGMINVPFSIDEKSLGAINDFAVGLRDRDGTRISTVEVGSATCLLFPRWVWEKAGRFDEEFFLYGEDSEFTHRVRTKLGLSLCWRHAAYVHHYKAKSVGKAIEAFEFDYKEVRKEATRLWRIKTGKDPETGHQIL
jgi:hypothetical protein